MRLYEFQGKKIFKEYGIPIQSGELFFPGESLSHLKPPLVLKSQVLVGGRGKAGGVKIWDGQQEINRLADELFHLKIKDEKVKAILALDEIEILRELYLSITFNRSKSTPLLIAGITGGMDIEKIAQKDKKQIYFIEYQSLMGISDFQIRFLAKKLKIENKSFLKKIIHAMYRIFNEYDATLVEINPLAITPGGLIAIDSKIELDDHAYFRHQSLFQKLQEEKHSINQEDPVDKYTNSDTITYVPLSGNIALVSDGAGTGLLTLDLLSQYGGKVANFCELGGITSPEIVYKALRKVHQDNTVKSILVVLIGGFNRMDEMAEGIVRFRKEMPDGAPLFIRMCGTKEIKGKKLMDDARISIDDNLHSAVKKAVRKAMED